LAGHRVWPILELCSGTASRQGGFILGGADTYSSLVGARSCLPCRSLGEGWSRPRERAQQVCAPTGGTRQSQPRMNPPWAFRKLAACLDLLYVARSSSLVLGPDRRSVLWKHPDGAVKPAPSAPARQGNLTAQAVRRGKSGHPRAGFPARNVVAPARLTARLPAGVASAQAGARRVKPP
jgi:hypothetical protein